MYVKRVGKANIRFIMTDRDETYTAKCRIPGVPGSIKNPTMEGLYDVMIRTPNKSVLDLSGATTSIVGAPTGGTDEGPKMMRKKA
jgi:hypothetical protein